MEENLASPLLGALNTKNGVVDILFSTNGSDNKETSNDGMINSCNHKGFSAFTAVCFTVNFMVGTGFLTLPWAFVQGGLILSTILIISSSILCDAIKDHTLESMARAEAIVPISESTQNVENKDENVNNLNNLENNQQEKEDINENDESPLLVKDRKFEMSDLCLVFLGEKAAILWACLLSITIFLSLWAYTVVFITVFLDLVSVTNNRDVNAAIYTFFFALIVVPLACLELKEQIPIQILLASSRIIMFLFMVFTTILFPEEFRDTYEVFKPPTLFSFSGIHRCVPIIVFALSFQTVIPGISKETKNKRQLGGIFQFTFYLCAFCYTLVGICVSMASGQSTPQSSNVMWKKFHGGTGELNEDGEWVNVAIWAKAVSYFVIIFPALDVLSAFPLQAICLGSNLLDVVYGDARNEAEVNIIIFCYLRNLMLSFKNIFYLNFFFSFVHVAK